jgi:hypothetical protein
MQNAECKACLDVATFLGEIIKNENFALMRGMKKRLNELLTAGDKVQVWSTGRRR